MGPPTQCSHHVPRAPLLRLQIRSARSPVHFMPRPLWPRPHMPTPGPVWHSSDMPVTPLDACTFSQHKCL